MADPALFQTWRPRYDAYAVAGEDLKICTLGRFLDESRARRRAGVRPTRTASALAALRGELVPVETPVGAGWILARDEASLRNAWEPPTANRLPPSGETWYLLQSDDRALLVPDVTLRGLLWTSRVWPGALLAGGEVVGTWRRARERVSIQPWRRPTGAVR